MGRVLVMVGVAFCLCLGTSVPTYAQRDTEDASDPRALFAEGRGFMRDGRFADARDAFRRSLELNPRASVAFNLAVAYTRTGEYVAATTLFTRLLDADFGDLPEERRLEADSLRTEANASVATLTLRLPPAEGLDVRVDGQVYGEQMRLDPGEHIVNITSPRHVPVEVRVTLERGGAETLRPELELREDARLGRLRVSTPVEGGLLSIDGVTGGSAEIDERLSPGEYMVVLRFEGEENTRLIQVEAGVEARYELDFQRSSRRAWPWVVAGILVVGAAAGVATYFLTRPQLREDAAFGQFSTLRAR